MLTNFFSPNYYNQPLEDLSLCVPPFVESGTPFLPEPIPLFFIAENEWVIGLAGVHVITGCKPFYPEIDDIPTYFCLNPLNQVPQHLLNILTFDDGTTAVSTYTSPTTDGGWAALMLNYAIPPSIFSANTSVLSQYPNALSVKFTRIAGIYSTSVFTPDALLNKGHLIVNALIRRQDFGFNQKWLESKN